jgi:hypothetical protein
MQKLDFAWHVPPHEIWIESAHEWTTPSNLHLATIPEAALIKMSTEGPPRSFLTNGSMPWNKGARRYSPFSLPISLFRTFADTELTEQAILHFANTYGLLGRTVAIIRRGDRAPSIADGESLQVWRAEVSLMKAAVRLWDAIRARDLKALRTRIHWGRNDLVSYDAQSDIGDIGASIPELEPETTCVDLQHLGMRDVFQKGDVIRPAIFILSRIVDCKLKNQVSATTTADFDHLTLRMSFSPSNLLAALWLQFSLSVDRDENFKKCRQCGKWFALAPGTGRADKEFCSGACRSKAYRNRQADAQALHQTGLSVSDIARQLGVEKQVVKKWISDQE